MKVSRNWLQTFFEAPLPSATALESLLTFHSSEIEEVITVGDDEVLDVKVLPDKSAWLLSHRGVAKEISVITGKPLIRDPFRTPASLAPTTPELSIVLSTDTCDYYSAAIVTDVVVGPSPVWLVAYLAAIGQRSINNVVDATNYVMFELGQPLHAFDAAKLGRTDNQYQIGVRNARPQETIVTLTGESYVLTNDDALIVDRTSDTPIGIAGIKGGQAAAVDAHTTTLIIEAAHFDRVAIRNSTKRLKLATDASKRYENGISKAVAPIALAAVVRMITEIAGGELVGYQFALDATVHRTAVSVPLARVRSVLGLPLSAAEIAEIFERFGYEHTITDTDVTVIPPFERDDLVLPEDVIEEIGRIYGLDTIVAIPPTPAPVAAFNARHYYAEIIRATLTTLGFSEVFTSSFRSSDVVHIKNALASDKSYLRSRLADNIGESVQKNIPHRDLLGLSAIKIFEIGTVFAQDGETVHVGIGVQTGTAYKAKVDDPLVLEAQAAVRVALGVPVEWTTIEYGVSEFSLDEEIVALPRPSAYIPVLKTPAVTYIPFSLYPASSRDIAMWVGAGIAVSDVETTLRTAAGPLLVRLTHLDTFTKDGRTSLAFRLVFQASDHTLAEQEITGFMNTIYKSVAEHSWEVR